MKQLKRKCRGRKERLGCEKKKRGERFNYIALCEEVKRFRNSFDSIHFTESYTRQTWGEKETEGLGHFLFFLLCFVPDSHIPGMLLYPVETEWTDWLPHSPPHLPHPDPHSLKKKSAFFTSYTYYATTRDRGEKIESFLLSFSSLISWDKYFLIAFHAPKTERKEEWIQETAVTTWATRMNTHSFPLTHQVSFLFLSWWWREWSKKRTLLSFKRYTVKRRQTPFYTAIESWLSLCITFSWQFFSKE